MDAGGLASNPMDADENDVGPTPRRAAVPRPRQARRRKREVERDQGLSDTDGGHQPLHVENDVADLGKFMSLMQPQDVAKSHDFGPTLEEYAVSGVPVGCGAN